MLSRRKLLTGMLAAPLVVKAGVLMPVRKIIVPEYLPGPARSGAISRSQLLKELMPGLQALFDEGNTEYTDNLFEGRGS